MKSSGQGTAVAVARAREVWSDPGLRQRLRETAKYLTTTEVHTYAFSVAANAILSFFPFLLLMFSVTERQLHSKLMSDVLVDLLRDYLPAGQDFVINNLRKMVWAHGGIKIFSLAMLLFSSSGVFLPLEVALNKVWGIPKNRSYWGNQIVSLALAFGCGALAMLSVAATAGNQYLISSVLGDFGNNVVVRGFEFGIMKIFALIAGVLIFFSIFYVLPNGRVPFRPVLRSALITGVVWECCKYLYILSLPLLKLQDVYGPFSISVTLMFWAFLSGLLLLGGAHLSSTRNSEELATL